MQAKVSSEISAHEVGSSNQYVENEATTLNSVNRQPMNYSSVQRTVSNLHKVTNVSSKQKLLRSIQRQHGNQYTARIVQRYRAEQIVQRWPGEETSGETATANTDNGSYGSKLLIKYLQTNYPELYTMATTLFGPAMMVVTFIAERIGIPVEVLIERSNKSAPEPGKSQPSGGSSTDNSNPSSAPAKPPMPTDPTNTSIREALDKITLTETKRVTERFVKPEVLHLVAHLPEDKTKKGKNSGQQQAKKGKKGQKEGGNPRHVIWGPLTDLLREYNAARRKPDFTPKREKAYQVKIEEAEKTAENRLLNSGKEQSVIDKYKLIGYEKASESEKSRLTAEFEVVDYRVQIGNRTVNLNSVPAGDLVERPGGFQAAVYNEAGKQQFPKWDPEAVTKALDRVFKKRENATEDENALTDTKRAIAESYGKVITKAEGSPTSLNTYDRLALTLGSGIGASGVLQGLFDNFKKSDPEGFHELFGQYGIGIKPGKGRGNDKFMATNPETGETFTDGYDPDNWLYNDAEKLPAREYIANNPKLLAVLVTAGFDSKWQYQLLVAAFNSVNKAFDYNLQVDKNTSFNIFNLLNGHVTDNQLKVATFTIADKIHGAGSVKKKVRDAWIAVYLELAKKHGFDSTQPDSMSDDARKELALYLIDRNKRKKHIPQALGIADYAELSN
jgi:hypothetical protein